MTLTHPTDAEPVPPFVLAVLARFDAAWPKRGLTDASATLWAETLVDLDPGVADNAARMLVASSLHYPSVSEFLDTYRGIARRKQEQQSTDDRRRALPPSADHQLEVNRRGMAKVRAAKAAADPNAWVTKANAERAKTGLPPVRPWNGEGTLRRANPTRRRPAESTTEGVPT